MQGLQREHIETEVQTCVKDDRLTELETELQVTQTKLKASEEANADCVMAQLELEESNHELEASNQDLVNQLKGFKEADAVVELGA